MLLRILIVLLLIPTPCLAKKKTLYHVYDPIVDPVLTRKGVIIDDDEELPIEPNIIETKFLEQAPPRNLVERIDRLVYGIEIDIPPEYDVYGYEIRRYMSRIGNMKIYSDEDYLVEQIKNVRKASVIMDYWQEHVNEEIKNIEDILAETEPSSTAWTTFRQNKQIVRTFMVDARSWIDTNERFLLNVYDNFGEIKVEYPQLEFYLRGARIDYYNVLRVRQINTREIRKYQSFSMMVY